MKRVNTYVRVSVQEHDLVAVLTGEDGE